MPEPATRSLTVPDTRTSWGRAAAATRAPVGTAMPLIFDPATSHSPACSPGRSSKPSRGAADVLRQVAPGLDRDGPVTNAMENQRRRLDRRQNVTDIDLVIGPHQREDGSRAHRGPLQPTKPLDERFVASTARCVDGDENALTPVGLQIAKESCPLLLVHGPRLRLYRGKA